MCLQKITFKDIHLHQIKKKDYHQIIVRLNILHPLSIRRLISAQVNRLKT